MGRHADVGERERSARRGDDVRCRKHVGRGEEAAGLAPNARPTRTARRTAEVAHLDGGDTEAHSPRPRPFRPALFLLSPGLLLVVDLIEPVVNDVRREPELKSERILNALELEVLREPRAHDAIREAELILCRLPAGRYRAPRSGGDRRRRLAPRVAPDRLVDRVHAERRRAIRPGDEQAEAGVERTPRLPNALAAGVQLVHAVDSPEAGPEHASGDGDAGVGEAASEHAERVVVLFGAELLGLRERRALREENWRGEDL